MSLLIGMTSANALSVRPPKRGRTIDIDAARTVPTLYAGLFVYESGPTASAAPAPYDSPSYPDFTARFDQLLSRGIGLVSFDTLERDRETRFVGAWQPNAGGSYLWRSDNLRDFADKFRELKGTYEIASLDIHPSGGTYFVTGAWLSGTAEEDLVLELSWDDFIAERDRRAAQGWRLTRIQAYPSAGPDLYTGAFRKGDSPLQEGDHALLAVRDWKAFYDYYRAHEGTLRLVDFQVYDAQGERTYIGVWLREPGPQELDAGLDWGSFNGRWEELKRKGYLLKRLVAYPSGVVVPEPDWSGFIKDALSPRATGYAFAVARHGKLVTSGASGFARTQADAPSTPWTTRTRINLASVSKPLTAVAVLKVLDSKKIGVDEPFYPFLAKTFPQAGDKVNTVSIRNLLTMKSGMEVGPDLLFEDFGGDVDKYMENYLKKALVGTPGETYAYSNTNFTILQILIEQLSGDRYAHYVTREVVDRMGIDSRVFNLDPDPVAAATLSYGDGTDPRHGYFWKTIPALGAAGWVSSAEELLKLLMGVRDGAVLSPDMGFAMLNDLLGWDVYDGTFGPYFYHNGDLATGGTDIQGLNTGIVHFTDGYDALLLLNSWAPVDADQFDVIKLLIRAFQDRGTAAPTWPIATVTGTA
jgi:CubicO group peptidase (beta-lactamase class C family)